MIVRLARSISSQRRSQASLTLKHMPIDRSAGRSTNPCGHACWPSRHLAAWPSQPRSGARGFDKLCSIAVPLMRLVALRYFAPLAGVLLSQSYSPPMIDNWSHNTLKSDQSQCANGWALFDQSQKTGRVRRTRRLLPASSNAGRSNASAELFENLVADEPSFQAPQISQLSFARGSGGLLLEGTKY
jgi:hypothetical protein